jgi:hypothetical protein
MDIKSESELRSKLGDLQSSKRKLQDIICELKEEESKVENKICKTEKAIARRGKTNYVISEDGWQEFTKELASVKFPNQHMTCSSERTSLVQEYLHLKEEELIRLRDFLRENHFVYRPDDGYSFKRKLYLDWAPSGFSESLFQQLKVDIPGIRTSIESRKEGEVTCFTVWASRKIPYEINNERSRAQLQKLCEAKERGDALSSISWE